jgi:hypothetical protein
MMSLLSDTDTTSTNNDLVEDEDEQQDDSSSRRARVAVCALARNQEEVFVFGQKKTVNDTPNRYATKATGLH